MQHDKNISVTAKKKLKAHLQKNFNSDFTPTESIAWYWWHVINKAAFKSQLPQPTKISVRTLYCAWGECLCDYRNNTSEISISIAIQTRKMFIATVAHEMVHQWQFHFGSKVNHGKQFKDWDTYFRNNFQIII